MREFSPYEKVLASFCKSYSRFLKEIDGCTDMERIKELSKELQKKKDDLLQIKERIGFTSGLKFLDTQFFDGFKIVKGDIEGSVPKAYRWASTQAERYMRGEEKAEIIFEVAILIFALVPYSRYLKCLNLEVA